jgi:predicted nucleic acid-binding protein
MSDRIFADTNILVYSVSDDLRKRAIAENLLIREDIVISPQVISEFVAVTLRKHILERAKVIEYAQKFLRVFPVTVMTADTVSTALQIMGKYGFSYWDSLILAAALESRSQAVYSEDLQAGQVIEGRLTVINPFT